MRAISVADLFCGAGGSSTGAQRALTRLGLAMDLVCVNHWPVAIETHSRNHPEARHYCMDLEAAKPEAIVPDGRLDLLMASPTCTYHSRARGGRPVNDQQRMDPWHVVRWCTTLRVKRLIVENVPEFIDWGPIDLRSGRPIKRRRGEYFRAWVAALEGCGFKVEWRILNAADFGDATTRERFFLLGRSDGRRINWPDPTHSRDGIDLLGQVARKWRAARDIIDWSIAGRSIFDRKRPLSPKTLARIHAGAVKFRWPEPFLVILRNHMAAQSVDGPLPTITTGGGKGGSQIYLAEPFILNRHGDNGGTRAHDLDEPVPTADCRGAGYLCEPFVFGNRENNTGKSLDEPIPTATTAHGGGIAVAEPFIATLAHGNEAHERNPDARRCRSIDDPLQTIHAGGGKFGIVEPFVSAMRDGNAPSAIGDPIPAITTKAQLAVVEPFILSQASGGAPRSTGDPVPTIATGGAHALIAPYYGSGSGETCSSADGPLPTVTTKPRFGLVMPVTHADIGNRARSLDDPIPTITTAKRGELAFITTAFGERDGQLPRVHSIDDPTPTICAQGRIQLVEPAAEGRRYDIRFRMLEPHELARAMGFSDDESQYEFCGNKTEITRQIGNAVPVATAAALVAAIMS